MPKKIRAVLWTEEKSPFGRMHLLALLTCPQVELLCIVVGQLSTNRLKARAPFVSTRDFLVRTTERLLLEARALRVGGWGVFRSCRPPVLRPRGLDGELAARLIDLRPDVFLSAGYTRILPRDILAVPRLGAFNFHPSLLPAYAGANPWFWILRHGELGSGVTVHWMVPEVDAGDIVLQRAFPLSSDTTYPQLYNRSSYLSARLMPILVRYCLEGKIPRHSQDLRLRSCFRNNTRDDHCISWSESSTSVLNLLRASFPHPGARACFGGREFVIRKAHQSEAGGTATPGTVVDVTHAGPSIQTGAGILVITTALIDGNEVSGARAASLLDLRPGFSLERPISSGLSPSATTCSHRSGLPD